MIRVGADSDGDGRTLNLAKAMREAARIGDRTQLRELFSAKDAYEIVHALHSILLDVINAERTSGRLEPLELDDIHAMFLSEESHEPGRTASRSRRWNRDSRSSGRRGVGPAPDSFTTVITNAEQRPARSRAIAALAVIPAEVIRFPTGARCHESLGAGREAV
jgi:hypothetical protein